MVVPKGKKVPGNWKRAGNLGDAFDERDIGRGGELMYMSYSSCPSVLERTYTVETI